MENLYKLYPQTKTEKELVKKTFLPYYKELGVSKNANLKHFIDTAYKCFLEGNYDIPEKLANKLSKTLCKKDISSFKSDFENYLHYNPIYVLATLICYNNSVENGKMKKNTSEILQNYIIKGGNAEMLHLYNFHNIKLSYNFQQYVSFISSINFECKFRENFSISPIEILFEQQCKLIAHEKLIDKLNQDIVSFPSSSTMAEICKRKLAIEKNINGYDKRYFNKLFDKCDHNMLENIALFKDKYLESYNKIKYDESPENKRFCETFKSSEYNNLISGYYPENNRRIYQKVEAKRATTTPTSCEYTK